MRVQRLPIGIGAVELRFVRFDEASVFGGIMDSGVRRLAHHDGFVAVAEQLQSSRVDEGDDTGIVHAVYAIADRTQDAVQTLAFGFDRFLHLDLSTQRMHARKEQLLGLVLEHAFGGAGVETTLDHVLAIRAGNDRQCRRTGLAGQASA